MRPLIGITTGEIRNLNESWAPVSYGQSYTYSECIINAGGVPVFIPLTNDLAVVQEIYARLDGILFSGGNDVDAKLYNRIPYKDHEVYSERRDYMENYMMREALKDNKPLLCICRGMQLLNIHLGGSLYQDLSRDAPDAGDHQLSSKAKDIMHIAHRLKIDKNSRLKEITGTTRLGANTHHHQAIDKLAVKLKAVAWAKDGIIEAVELAGHPYCFGVQCHPESLALKMPEWQNLFNSFVLATRQLKPGLL